MNMKCHLESDLLGEQLLQVHLTLQNAFHTTLLGKLTICLKNFLQSAVNLELLENDPDHHGVRALSERCQYNIRGQRDGAEPRQYGTG